MRDTLLSPILYGWTRLHGVWERRVFRRSAIRCADVQRRILLGKLRRAAGTEYGRRHLFSKISSPDDYRRAVPIVDYTALAPYVERVVNGERNILFPPSDKLIMFAMTSGTTAAPKYVPVTASYLRELARGNFFWGLHLVADHPRVLAHKILHVISPSEEGRTASGVPCGAATGLVAESQKKIAHLKYAMPFDVYGIRDYDAKYYTILRLAMEQRISLLIAANPSTLVALGLCLEKNIHSLIRDLRDGTCAKSGELGHAIAASIGSRLRKRPGAASKMERLLSAEGTLAPRDVWPDLEAIGCWTGGTLTPYLDLVKAYWGERPLRDPGLIASEGRMTIPIEDGDGGGVLDLMSHFYEFLPYGAHGSETLLAHELELGKSYYILLTTSSGFFRYNISDVVQVSGFFEDAPVLKFLHKGSRISSLTGEKISEHQVVEAFRACERALGFAVPLFTVCPAWGTPPRYCLLVEERLHTADMAGRGTHFLSLLAERFDAELKHRNIEYGNKRESGRLACPCVKLIGEGSFHRDKLSQIHKSGGRVEQYKHPYLSPLLDHHTRFPVIETMDTQ